MADKPERPKTRLTQTDVARIVGEVEDEQAVALIATGASVAELEEAALLAEGETDVLSEARVALSPKVAAAYDILTTWGAEPDEPA